MTIRKNVFSHMARQLTSNWSKFLLHLEIVVLVSHFGYAVTNFNLCICLLDRGGTLDFK